MSKRIAIEEGLSQVKSYLEGNGYNVVNLAQSGEATHCDCYVISGMDENTLGVADTEKNAPIIDARGMTPEEVYEQVYSKVGQ